MRRGFLVETAHRLLELHEREQIRVVRKADVDAGAEARERPRDRGRQRLHRLAAEPVGRRCRGRRRTASPIGCAARR